jgi:uncharacterized integral membrane protein (TIGR00697 family)
MSSTLHPIEASEIHARRERVFIVLVGVFLGSMTLLNVLGISRFILLFDVPVQVDGHLNWDLAFAVAVGVLPYPITFLCTDFISEFYGRKRANWVVLTGLLLNLWVVFILWLGGELPGFEKLNAAGEIARDSAGRLPTYFEVQGLAFSAVFASMIAYMAAQFCDVYLSHALKRLTQGRHLWLRNNLSTLGSQMVDTVAVVLITHYATESGLPMHPGVDEGLQILAYIGTGYLFKAGVALLDTIPFYMGCRWLKGYLQFDPNAQYRAEATSELGAEAGK